MGPNFVFYFFLYISNIFMKKSTSLSLKNYNKIFNLLNLKFWLKDLLENRLNKMLLQNLIFILKMEFFTYLSLILGFVPKAHHSLSTLKIKSYFTNRQPMMPVLPTQTQAWNPFLKNSSSNPPPLTVRHTLPDRGVKRG